jgi:Protein kinase domain/PDZ domain/GAF domain
MYVVATCYVVTFVFILYQLLYGPAQLNGFSTTFADRTMTILTVTEGSPESRAGLRVGDRVMAIDDQPIHVLRDWVAATANLRVGLPQRWLVAREDAADARDMYVLDVYPLASSFRSRVAEGYIQYSSLLITGLALGLLIAWKRPGDAVGRLGAWFMLTMSIAFGFPWGWPVPWRALPTSLRLMLWLPQLSRFVIEGIFLSFFLVFPRRLLTRRWLWLLLWIPVLVTLPWRIQDFYGVIYPGEVEPVPAWILQAGFARTIVYLLVAIGILAVSYRRLLDRNEKRRVRVLMVGTAATALSAMFVVWIDNFLGRVHLRESNLEVLVILFVAPFNTACPLSLAYAILRHRVLEISLIVRQGLQYVLARGAVIALVPALAGILILDLAFNSHQTLVDIFRSRGWFYAIGASLSMLTYWKRHAWLDAIDRRFFRERYKAQQVLRDVLEEVRTARDFQRVAPRVAERLETAFHPEFVSVMVREPGEPEYRSLVSVPPAQAPPPLGAETKIVGLLRVLGKPLEVMHSNSRWLDRRLPSEEAELLRRAGVDMLVPITMSADRKEALLTLGVKRSQEPYTREDQEFLEAIALLAEQPVPVTVPVAEALRTSSDSQAPPTFQECPECGACYEPASTMCDRDRATLVRIRVPRILAGRYRLDRRRGRGGMGTVYQATDNELGRQVAIKLIRDDWSDQVEARQRFRREARAAATFTHPNVVTVHDYGVESESRAYLVMELLEGVTLGDELDHLGHLDPARVVETFRGVCAAVGAAHRHHFPSRSQTGEHLPCERPAGRRTSGQSPGLRCREISSRGRRFDANPNESRHP